MSQSDLAKYFGEDEQEKAKDITVKTVEDYVNNIVYEIDDKYIPGAFALEFINFIKLVNGTTGEENLTPVLHFRMLDQIAGKKKNIVNMLFRGAAKTTLLGEYLFLYLGVYGALPDFGVIQLALYVSDSIENGVKNMRKNLEYRWENSEFLKEYITYTRFTDVRWEFQNKAGNTFVVKGYGAKTGVRGSKEMGVRPVLAVLDDLVSDEDARSATIIASIEDTVYKAIDYALHPTKSKVIWSGTPFNSKDPLYKAVESGAWHVNVYPVCEKFPCTKEEFRGAWEDRFTFEYVKEKYIKALRAGKIDTFNQELMLRIMSEEDRLIQDADISWYERRSILDYKARFNFYITTDFATSEKTSADFSVISVWAYNNVGSWFWVDGVCKKQLMDKNVDDLFRLAQVYKPQQVAIEVSGQQGGFIPWIQREMLSRNQYFTLASENNNNKAGIRPNTNKMERFNVILPLFKMNKMYFPEERKESPEMIECMNELSLAARSGFKSKHDDFLDTISMLSSLTPWKPTEHGEMITKDRSGIWELDEEEETKNDLDSYIV
jgi:phage terminase large subunit-like protein